MSVNAINDFRLRRWRSGVGIAAACSLLLLGACSDGVEPTAIASIQLLTESNVGMAIGESLTLMTDIRDTRGESLYDQTATWSTSDPSVATVDRNGRVTAVGAGTVTITASVSGLKDSVVLTVGQLGNNGCESATSFGIGEVRALSPGSNGAVCLPGGASYTMVLTNSAQSGSVGLQLSGSSLALSSASLSLTPSAGGSELLSSNAGPERDWAAESEMRARARTALREHEAAARAARGATSGARLSITSGVPAVGTLLRLNASTDPCGKIDERIGRVVSISQTTIVVADTANPKNGFTDADYRQIGATMDTLIVPVVTEAFGTPADIDSNGHVVLFYTRAVNEMTARGEDSYVGGFFYSRDLFPTSSVNGIQGCAGSNAGELMYMLAPDPNGDVNGNRRSTDFIKEATAGVAAHELQHLVNASRRLFVINADDYDEEVWLNEGLSHIAEELVFYRASGLRPGQNIDLDDLRGSSRTADAFNRYAIDNFGRLMDHLRTPWSTSPYVSDDELSTRGATWSFLRYLADRRGGDQNAFWQSLANSKTTGMTNLRAATGADPLLLVRDWAIATVADDRGLPVATSYSQPSWNFRSIYTAFSSTRGVYPLSPTTLASSGTSLSLRSGGSAYVPVSVAGGMTGEVRILSGGQAPPAAVKVVALRTQ